MPHNDEYVPSSPEYKITDTNTSSDISVTLDKCKHIINNEPNGILLDTLLKYCKNTSDYTTLFTELFYSSGVDIVFYPSPPRVDQCLVNIERYLCTCRKNESTVFDVQSKFPRITASMWCKILRHHKFDTYYHNYKNQKIIRLRVPTSNRRDY